MTNLITKILQVINSRTECTQKKQKKAKLKCETFESLKVFESSAYRAYSLKYGRRRIEV